MSIQILTKDDVKGIETLQERMVAALEIMAGKKPTVVLRSSEIRSRLGLNSSQSFADRVPELIRFGLFKDGQYSITEEDLERYIDHLKTKHLKG